jgi:hypothetical protein
MSIRFVVGPQRRRVAVESKRRHPHHRVDERHLAAQLAEREN